MKPQIQIIDEGCPSYPDVVPCSLPSKWTRIVNGLHHAFQPVVNIHSGQTYGLEALIRGYHSFGFKSVGELLNAAADDGIISSLECMLKRKAIAAYAQWPHCHDRKLFINVDGRSISSETPGQNDAVLRTRQALAEFKLDEATIIFDITEKASYGGALAHLKKINKRKGTGIRYSIDDFGTGFSSLQMLQNDAPDFIKIDRSMIEGVTEDNRQKTFFSHVVSIAHLFGILVIAEGIETKGEYYVCKEVGCDLIQGYIVGQPHNIADCSIEYSHIGELSSKDRRQSQSDERILTDRMEMVEAISIDTPMLEVFERFRAQKTRTFFPVVDSTGEPRGIIREGNFKDYTYSQFGRDLMSNRTYGHSLGNFITPCPVASLSLSAERILEIYSGSSQAEGLIIVDDGLKYAGFLSANALLRVINDKNLTLARDQNPLSRLPGNTVIHEFLSECLGDATQDHVIVYYDFDNFKPFNDHYGFRQGDRAIKAFADILRQNFHGNTHFIAHIGGDDFVAGIKNLECFEAFKEIIERSIAQFSDEVSSYYDDEARQRGYIMIKDRYGTEREFPLLTVSASVVQISQNSVQRDEENLGKLTAILKKAAKASDNHMASGILP